MARNPRVRIVSMSEVPAAARLQKGRIVETLDNGRVIVDIRGERFEIPASAAIIID
jgi:hypothetical protein